MSSIHAIERNGWVWIDAGHVPSELLKMREASSHTIAERYYSGKHVDILDLAQENKEHRQYDVKLITRLISGLSKLTKSEMNK